jgi:mannonate dehydratase
MNLDLMYLGVPTVVLGTGAERDAAIEKVCLAVRRAGQAGIPALQYNLHVRDWRPRTAPTPGRGGAMYSSWDLAKAEDRLGRPSLAGVSARDMWGRIAHFLGRVVPAAAEAKVRLAMHPPDPPIPAENRWNVAQVLDTVEGMQRFVQTAASPYHGVVFCQGTFAEMLREPAREIFDVIRWFGSRRTIVSVHFRNLRGARDRFVETFPDEGDINMYKAVLAYKEAGYAGMLMPDHVPRHPDDPDGLQGFAFAYGYIHGLLQAAYGP